LLLLSFQQYGDIRTLYTATKHRGFVMISYFDIRSARNAMRALQNKPLRRRKLDIHFSIPKVLPTITFYYFVKPHGMIVFISQKHHQKYLLG
jgi:hypothetical protein